MNKKFISSIITYCGRIFIIVYLYRCIMSVQKFYITEKKKVFRALSPSRVFEQRSIIRNLKLCNGFLNL